MNDLDPDRLGTALHDRLRDERLDLERLVVDATRTGTRIRRRRATVTVLAACAGVAAVAFAGSQLAGSSGTTNGGPGFADRPRTAEPTDRSSTGTGEGGSGLDELARLATEQAELMEAARDRAPFDVTVPGWACDEPADEKFGCTRGTESLHLVWRPAASRPKYLGPDGSGPGTYVSDVHGGIFVTVEPGVGTSAEAAAEVGATLAWSD
ncbi:MULTISPECIES: hypothetical protein [unclassified Nocardioides]|uniref:hypothetical protein n=1 Tax=unclassified Nocardioides TaxID=2615069 RepID=UPI003014DC60